LHLNGSQGLLVLHPDVLLSGEGFFFENSVYICFGEPAVIICCT
jgi:hypothetical protein